MAQQPLALDLVFPPLADDLVDAVIHVTVEDVGEADAPARVLLQQDFTHVSVRRDTPLTRLELVVPDLRGAARAAVRVHVDRSATGTVRPGDFINPAIADVDAGSGRSRRIELTLVR